MDAGVVVGVLVVDVMVVEVVVGVRVVVELKLELEMELGLQRLAMERSNMLGRVKATNPMKDRMLTD